MRKPGYHIVELEEECSQLTDGAHCRAGSDYFHFHYKIWLPIALKQGNIDEWLYQHEDELEDLIVREMNGNEFCK